ncbi:universal stress protein [Candidatus Uhrbacteria bacterium]|nr:universal stress protein [Candidatus Uhrbacteria bacterium]
MPHDAPLTRVCVPFRDTRNGRIAIQYAGDLAARCNVPLVVLTHDDDPCDDTAERARMTRYCETITTCPVRLEPAYRPDTFPAGTALVVQPEQADASDAMIVIATTEPHCAPRGNRSLCIPLGNGSSGIRAMEFGIALARTLDTDIVLYHSTWRDPRIHIEDPKAHVCADARRVIDAAQIRLGTVHARCALVIETAERVAAGIIRTALRQRAAAIVMSRGTHTGYGSYVDQVVRESPIPVIIVPTPEEDAS